jgi:UDP-3-O-[3-hydroxymyristoyl] N-acetylglucosamine deacetylase
MRLLPAPAGKGIVFRRVDMPERARNSGSNQIVARFDSIVDSRLGMTLGNKDGVRVATVEHLMAAFMGCGIDNVEVELTGPEVPAMDGSAAPFVFLIECAGLKQFNVRRRALRILQPVVVEDGDKRAELMPAPRFTVDIEIDFAASAVRRQRFIIDVTEAEFRTHVSRARTFGFLSEVESLRANGLALGGSLENAVVVDGDMVLNADGLRFSDEFVRHKALDAIGDLALAGAPILGRFRGLRSGHTLNASLLQALFASDDAFEFVTLSDPERTALEETVTAGGAIGISATA